MSRWSPQCRKTIVRGGAMREGAKLVNINRRGLLFWPTQAMVTDVRARAEDRLPDPRELDDLVLHPDPTADGGTRVVQRREAPKGISDVSVRLTKAVLGGVDDFTTELEQGHEPDPGADQGRRRARRRRLGRRRKVYGAPAAQDPAVGVVLELDATRCWPARCPAPRRCVTFPARVGTTIPSAVW